MKHTSLLFVCHFIYACLTFWNLMTSLYFSGKTSRSVLLDVLHVGTQPYINRTKEKKTLTFKTKQTSAQCVKTHIHTYGLCLCVVCVCVWVGGWVRSLMVKWCFTELNKQYSSLNPDLKDSHTKNIFVVQHKFTHMFIITRVHPYYIPNHCCIK